MAGQRTRVDHRAACTRRDLDLAGELGGLRVLDVGRGDGTNAIAAAERGALVAGIDIAPEMIRAAEARAIERSLRIDFGVGSATALPFDDGSFDVVIAATLLRLASDPEAVVAECARVTAPGGRVVIGELGRWSMWAASRRLRGWLGSPTRRTARVPDRTTVGEAGDRRRVGRRPGRGSRLLPAGPSGGTSPGTSGPGPGPVHHRRCRLHRRGRPPTRAWKSTLTDHASVLVLGGGVGGVVAAKSPRRNLPEQHRLVIVDRERDHLFAPSLLWLMTGRRTARAISRRPSRQEGHRGHRRGDQPDRP